MNPQVAEFSPPDQEILQEVLVYFLDEVEEHLSALRQGFQIFCAGGSDDELLLDLYHSVHTLKGSSSTVGLIHFSSCVRRLESAVHTFQDPDLQRTTILQTHLFAVLDCLQVQIVAIQRDSREDLDLQSIADQVFEQLENHLNGYVKDEHFATPINKVDSSILAICEDCQELLTEFEQKLPVLQDSEVLEPLQLLVTQVKGLARLFSLESFAQICEYAERILIKHLPSVALAQTILTELQRACDLVSQHQEIAILPCAALVALVDDPIEKVIIKDNQDLQRTQILQVMDQIRNNSSQIRRLNNQLKQLYNRLLNDNPEINDSKLDFQGVDLPTGQHFSNIQEMVVHLNVQVSSVSHLVEKAKEHTSCLRKNIDSLRKHPMKRMQMSKQEPSRPSILIVDDSAALRHMLALSLQRLGFVDVDIACDGQEALAMLQLNNYQLVISDIEMPRMNGIELLSQMQASARLASIPLIFLTSCTGEQYRRLAAEMGATDYLNKPHRESDLRRAIDAAMGEEISA